MIEELAEAVIGAPAGVVPVVSKVVELISELAAVKDAPTDVVPGFAEVVAEC